MSRIPVPAHITRGFLDALRAEYVNGVQGAVGIFIESPGAEQYSHHLLPAEDRVRNAGNKHRVIEGLANEWCLNSPAASASIARQVPSLQAQPVQAQLVQAYPAQAQPVQAQPVRAYPVPAQPAHINTAPPQVPGQAQVSFSSSTLISNLAKPHRLYNFMTSVADVHEPVTIRFSALKSALLDNMRVNLDFPSSHWFRDMNTDSNAEMRAGELLQYLHALLNRADEAAAGAITMDPRLHAALCCRPPLAAALVALGSGRRNAAQQRQQAEAARLAAIRQQQLEDRDFAQRVNQTGAIGQPVTMLFPRPLTFQLRNKMFSFRDQVRITGPGELDWFGMLRTSSLFSMMDTEVIATLSGEPLLALHRQFRWMHYEYRLERVTQGYHRIPLCVITRQHQFLAPATYTVQMLAPSFGGDVYCQGRWREDFVLYQGGAPACRIRGRAFSFSECYDVVVEPQRDVLLFVGIACAIDHIHHEIEERNRER